jgi:hypothetical protein
MLTPYPITLQQRMNRLHGHLYLVPGHLYFLCSARGGAWAQAIGQGIGGAVGGAIAAAAGPKAGDAPAVADEAALAEAVRTTPGSLAVAPGDVTLIKNSLWTGRALVTRGGTWGFWGGLPAPAAAAVGAWARAHGVATKGKSLAG